MKALIDRHQADLFYAMQLLFEDTLGIEVYTPVGHEWFDSGYWQFGHQHLGRALADQFLGIDARYTWNDDCYLNLDPAHPRRLIKCVTLEQFREMQGWTHIVATVQDNQSGFRRLADEVGAKYVLQVGNTRQDVAWSLDPLALVSSEVEIIGRGVRMHQSFDHETTFGFKDPFLAGPDISSFVNLLPRIEEVWPAAEDLMRALPDFEYGIFGIDGPQGNLHPVEAIATRMTLSAFGLHLKPTGDGFGHVIHGWAAVGRPLIGRGRYYKGQLAERFWQDGVTCVDLDLHTMDESAALIRDIWADFDRYAEMCHAIRAEFDTIDWAAEADAIRALLL